MRVTTIFAVLLCLAAAGCSDPFREAAERDTAAAWRAYLASEEGGDAEREHARERQDDLMWEEAKSLDTIASYRRYLEALPNGRNSPQAIARLETLRFENAVATGSAFAIDEFLARHPHSRHADAARSRLLVLRREDARERGTIEAYELFLRDFPGTEGTREMETELERLRFEKTIAEGSMDAVERHRRRFPDGVLRDQVEIHARSLRVKAYVLAGEDERAARIVAGSGQEAVRLELEQVMQEALVEAATLRLDLDALLTLGGREGPAGAKARALATELASRPDRQELFVAATRLMQEDTGLPGSVIGVGLSEQDARRRVVSARALGHSAHPRAIAPLASALKDRNLGVRAEAALALRRLGASLHPVVRDTYFTEALDRLDGVAADAELVWVAAVLLESAGLFERALEAYRRAAESPDQVLARLRLAELETDPYRLSVALTGATLWLRDALRLRYAAVDAYGRPGADDEATLHDASLLRQVHPLLVQLEAAADFAELQPEFEHRFTWLPEVRELVEVFRRALADAEARAALQDPEWIAYSFDEGARGRAEAARARAQAASRLEEAAGEISAIELILDASRRSPHVSEAEVAGVSLDPGEESP